MKKLFIYKKWNILILLNNLIVSGFLSFKKKLIFLYFDTTNFFFWVFTKKIKIKKIKIIVFKKNFKYN